MVWKIFSYLRHHALSNSIIASSIFRHHISQEEGNLVRVSREMGLPLASVGQTLQKLGRRERRDNTAFILGSGASVLDLKESQWARVGDSISIGFGAFPLHRFVPSAYAFSPVGELADYGRVYSEVMCREDIVSARPTILILRPRNQQEIDFFRTLPKEHLKQTLIYGRVGAVGPNPANLGHFVNDLRRASANRENSPLITLDSGATVVRLISMLALAGFKNVVLVGVDIINSHYFWEADADFLLNNGFSKFETGNDNGTVHKTQTLSGRGIKILDAIPALAKSVKKSFGMSVTVGTGGSALGDHLEKFVWSSSRSKHPKG